MMKCSFVNKRFFIYFKHLLTYFALHFMYCALLPDCYNIRVSSSNLENVSIISMRENDSDFYEYENFSTNATFTTIDVDAEETSTSYTNVLNETDFDNNTAPEISENTTNYVSNLLDKQQQSAVLENQLEDICSCDLLVKSCDINCCCDEDCSPDDILAFKKCYNQDYMTDRNYCYHDDIIYRNNTIFKIVKDEKNSLFCIVHDNYKERLYYRNLPVLRFPKDLIYLDYQNDTVFSWDLLERKEIPASNFKFGDPIHVKINTKRSHWRFPSSCFSNICLCYQKIGYLKDLNASCIRTIDNLQDQCKNDFSFSANTFLNFTIEQNDFEPVEGKNLSLLDLINERNNVKPQILVKNIPEPFYNPKTKTCIHVVSELSFLVTHNGIKGIQKIEASYKLKNLSDDSVSFRQSFNVKFKWYNSSDVITRRSGNPGYNFGLPVLSGEMINGTNGTSSVKTHNSGLTIMKANHQGICSKERKVIAFGTDYLTFCKMKRTTNVCKTLQQNILDVLEPSAKQTFVGIFGNANSSNANEWLEVFHDGPTMGEDPSYGSEACNLVTGVEIIIVYTAVGSTLNPQFKIIGVIFRYLSPQHVDISCEDGGCADLFSNAYIKLSTSVSFFDITQSAIALHSKIPSLKANLPHDFFYPFLLSKATTTFSCVVIVISMSISTMFYWKLKLA